MSSQMVLKQDTPDNPNQGGFRSMSSQMVLKLLAMLRICSLVLDLCHLKWY